jgi:modulator of FtsH protease HflK
MPWSSQGGGPWGSGKGPWGSGPQSSGPNPPDLEELLRRSQDKLRAVLCRAGVSAAAALR